MPVAICLASKYATGLRTPGQSESNNIKASLYISTGLLFLLGCSPTPSTPVAPVQRMNPNQLPPDFFDSMGYKLESECAVSLGTFETTGTKLIVSDPGYDLDTARDFGAILTNCQSGTWQAEVIIKTFAPHSISQVFELRATHSSVEDPATLNWERQNRGIGVDTAQAGVYDLAHFHDHSLVPQDIKWTFRGGRPAIPEDLWYSYCCELTGSKLEGSVLPFGVVTRSGEGDGRYGYSIARDEAGRTIGVWIIFLDDSGKR